MSEPRPLTRRCLTVTGKVQGVGFRWFARELAESLGLAGWVRNREDGGVEAEVEGEEAALDEFLRRLRTENPAARVDGVEWRAARMRGEAGFIIK
jgi:acylphosphatase